MPAPEPEAKPDPIFSFLKQFYKTEEELYPQEQQQYHQQQQPTYNDDQSIDYKKPKSLDDFFDFKNLWW